MQIDIRLVFWTVFDFSVNISDRILDETRYQNIIEYFSLWGPWNWSNNHIMNDFDT